MLDDNLRVLGRRIQELEFEVTDKQDKLQASEKERRELENKLATYHE